MSIVDVNAILTGTPTKRITLGYQNMKETYNETSAEEFFNIYSKESLSDILDNSEYIFTECYKGLDFYKDIVLNESSCIFTRFDSELNKVETYINEFADKVNDDQKDKITALYESMKAFRDKYSDVILVSSYINEKEENFEDALSNALYAGDNDKVRQIIESAYNEYAVYAYAPYIIENENFNERGFINGYITESVSSVIGFGRYAESSVVMHRLGQSDAYRRDLGNIGNLSTRMIIESWMDTKSVKDVISEELNITLEDAGVVLHEDTNDAVNSIFNDILEAALFEESYENKRNTANQLLKEAYDITMDMFTFEYGNSEPDDAVKGYSLIDDCTTFKEAYEKLSSGASMVGDDFFESSDEDDVDGELDSLSKDVEKDDEDDKKEKEDSKSDSKKVDNKKDTTSTVSSNTKPIKPKAKNLATAIQTKAQDLEVKQMGAYAKSKQKAAEIGRAAKAVATLPMNVVKDIKNQIKAIDEKDIERRRAYMTKPGFRKKAFRNLKLSIMYGTAAQASLSLVPVLALIRHFSKSKDKFVRVELIKDLATEIKVCEAKIEDAQNAGDNNEKYRLMRLKDQLERERTRVLFNSKRM
jgi:hypothetical protein